MPRRELQRVVPRDLARAIERFHAAQYDVGDTAPMLKRSTARIEALLRDEDLVLDVGGWVQPWARADWVLDVLPYATRGLYGYDREAAAATERFSAETWVERDACDREPWPFADGQFAFAVCGHTLEDLRDPVWVCAELQRVARAGYIEVPARLQEQTYGIHGPWVGWAHHHWLCDVHDGGIDFVFKSRALEGREEFQVPRAAYDALTPEERVQELWWRGPFAARERVMVGADEIDPYLMSVVPPAPARRRSLLRRRGT